MQQKQSKERRVREGVRKGVSASKRSAKEHWSPTPLGIALPKLRSTQALSTQRGPNLDHANFVVAHPHDPKLGHKVKRAFLWHCT